jgi:hypothetical protein
MDDPVSAFERFEEIARMAQVGKPARTQLLSRRNSVEAKNFVAACEQLPNNKLSQSAAAARNDDSFHFICSVFSWRILRPRSGHALRRSAELTAEAFARDTPSFIHTRGRKAYPESR